MAALLVKDPVYLQLRQALREVIHTEAMPPGTRFLTEREVGVRFGVSRATANKALASLVAEGVLEFRKGVGTFIRAGYLDYDLRSLVSFTDKARSAGKTPSTRVVDFRTRTAIDAEPAVREALGVEGTTALYSICRVRSADGVPVILERRWARAEFCPNLTTADLAGSLYAVWSERYGLSIVGADERISAVSLQPDEAGLLEVPPHSAALEIVSVGYLAGGEALWWERTLYRGDRYEVHNRLGPIEAAGPATGVLRDREASATAADHPPGNP